MASLIKSEFYKLGRSKAFLICCIITILISGVFIGLTRMQEKMVEEHTATEQTAEEKSESAVTFSTEGDAGAKETINAIILLTQACNNTGIPIILAVFAGIFVTGEFSSGAIKLNASRGHSRTQIYLSKYLCVLTAAFTFVFLSIITYFLGGLFVWELGAIPADFVPKLLVYLGTNLLLYTALTAFFTFIGFCFSSNGAAIALNICIYSFYPMLLMLLHLLLPDLSYNVEHLALGNQAQFFATLSPAKDHVINLLAVSAGYFALFLAGGSLLFRRKEL